MEGLLLFMNRNVLRVHRGVLSERKGKVTPCSKAEDRIRAGTNSGKSGRRNLEAESMRSRAESTGGCVMLKTVTEVRPSSALVIHLQQKVFILY